MPAFYYLSRDPKPSGEYEVHTIQCGHLPINKVYLGYFYCCEDAMEDARLYVEGVIRCPCCQEKTVKEKQ